MAKRAGAYVIATAFTKDVEYVQSLGADQVINVSTKRFEQGLIGVDVVIDTVGGEIQQRSFAVLKPGGILVSSVSQPDPDKAAKHNVQGVFFYVAVTTSYLTEIGRLIDARELTPLVGDVLSLEDVHTAHEMLAGQPHKRGKIVLQVDDTLV